MSETNESVKGEKERLQSEIKILKSGILQLKAAERNTGYCKFGHLQRFEKLIDPKEKIYESRQQITNCNTRLQRDLYRFSGIHCVRFDEVYSFQFSTGSSVSRGQTYAVQIENVAHRGKLGKWVLPMSMDVARLLSIDPIDDLGNLRGFVRSCKNHIDCYACRQEQYKELQVIAGETKNFCVDRNLGYTTITLQMLAVRDTVNNTDYDIILYLHYKSDEARPHAVQPDSIYEETLLMGTAKTLAKYYRPFKKLSLKEAFEAVVDKPNKGYVWKAIPREAAVVNVENTSSDESVELLQYIQKKKRGTKKNSTKTSKKPENEGKVVKAVADMIQDQKVDTTRQPHPDLSPESNSCNETTKCRLRCLSLENSSRHDENNAKSTKHKTGKKDKRKFRSLGGHKKSRSPKVAESLENGKKITTTVNRGKSRERKSIKWMNNTEDKTGTVSSTIPEKNGLQGDVISSTPLPGKIKDRRKFSTMEISEILSTRKNPVVNEDEKRNDLTSREEKEKTVGQKANSSDDEPDDEAFVGINKKALLEDLLAISEERTKNVAKAVKSARKK